MKIFGFWFVFVGMILASAPALAGSGTLPLVTVQDGEKSPQAWWSHAKPGAISTMEAKLLEALKVSGLPVLNPQQMPERPAISRIYRRPKLSTANAINLAGLHGAGSTLTGKIQFAPIPPVEMLALQGAQAEATVTLLSLPDGRTLLETHMVRRAYDADATVARQKAQESLVADLSQLMAASLRQASAPVGVTREEPFVCIAGLWGKAPLEQVKGVLKGLEGVEDVSLAWMAEGMVALDLNPDSEEQTAQVEAWTEGLVTAPPKGVRLTPEESASGLVCLRAQVAGE